MKVFAQINNKYPLSWYDKSFMRSFIRNVTSLSSEERENAIRRFVEIFNAEASNITDRASQSHHIMCAFVLAAYEQLRSKTGKQEAISELAEALKKHGGKFMKWGTRMVMKILSKKKLRNFIENFSLRRSQEAYGDTFLIVEERGEDYFASVVKRCGYFEFLKRKGVPELTKVFCEWDTLWSNEINRAGKGVRFARPTTIAGNAQECRFEFYYEE